MYVCMYACVSAFVGTLTRINYTRIYVYKITYSNILIRNDELHVFFFSFLLLLIIIYLNPSSFISTLFGMNTILRLHKKTYTYMCTYIYSKIISLLALVAIY